MNKQEIIKQLMPGALATYNKHRILPSVTIAQAILETGLMELKLLWYVPLENMIL